MKRKWMAVVLAGAVLAQSMLLGACGSKAGITDGTQEQTASDDGRQNQQEDTAAADAETSAEEQTQTEGTQAELEQTGTDSGQNTDGANGFAFRFTKAILEEKAEGDNLIVSPYSVWLPLAALSNATEEGAREELLSALGMSGMDEAALNEAVKTAIGELTCQEQADWMEENGFEYESPLKIANALFVGENSRTEENFESVFADYFSGKLFSVDFSSEASAEKVNEWAKEATKGKIDHIIDAFDPDTVAAIANAIYFSDAWNNKFSEEQTKEDVFHGKNTEEQVSFMNQKFTEMPYYEDDTMQAASLSTANGGQLILLLPKDGKSPEEILADMTAEQFSQIQGADFGTVQLSMPKFKLESDVFSVKEALELLGVPLTDAQKPCLSGLVENETLYISEAVQKAMIEVDEEGMTAAAVTIMAMERASLPVEQEPVELKCDRPFAFLLTAYGGAEGQQVLFAGVVNQIGQ
ncbi:MAG: serpin family protein [Eubacteriales bacterium]|nr:serpin family protein [Eubacteriales bacterium]